jgi:hypothetical protein
VNESEALLPGDALARVVKSPASSAVLGACIFLDNVTEDSWLNCFCPLKPTFIVRTSDESHQYFYVFSRPVPMRIYKALVKALQADENTASVLGGGHGDGCALAAYGRLPSGINPKEGRNGFPTELVEASGIKYPVDELAKGFGVKLPEPAAAAEPKVAIRLIRFEKPRADGPMTKTIKLGADGQPVSDASECRMWRGKAEVITIEGAAGLAEAIGACTRQQAFAMGVVKPELADARTKFDVAKKDALADAAKGTIARSKEHLEFTPGQPAGMLLDFDQKGMSLGADLSLYLAGGFRKAVIDVAPELAKAAWVVRASTSAGLVNTRTGEEFSGSGGLHGYVLVEDGADIPRAIGTLYNRARLKGYGWSLVSKAGSILPRSIVDGSKGAAHDLIFEGPPVLSEPLAQDARRRRPEVIEGGLADTRTAIPDLTDDECARLAAIDAAEQQELEAKARPIREAQIEKRVQRAVKAGSTTPVEVLRKSFAKAYGGRLERNGS